MFSRRLLFFLLFLATAMLGLAFIPITTCLPCLPDRQAVGKVGTIHSKDLMLKETRHDFGLIKSPWRQKHTFLFSNVGEHPLLISDIKTPCGCASPEWAKRPVMPGRVDSFVVTVDPRIIYGEFEKSLHVLYNDGRDTAQVTVAGNVELEQRF